MKQKIQAAAVCLIGIILFLCSFFADRAAGLNAGEQREEAVTVTWFVAISGYSKEWNPQENLSDAKILENTGVNLEIKSGDLTELDALIATDSLPDLITLEAGEPERSQLEDSGQVASLEPLFEQYAPESNIPDSMKEWYRNSDGNWYTIASYFYGPERTNVEYGGYLGSHNNNYVRSDLLRQTGIRISELHTKEGVLNALRSVRELTYQGEPVIPFSGWWTQSIAEQFGMQTEDEEGNLLSMYRQPEWLEALVFGNQLYREGLMTDEEFTESTNQRLKQVEAGRVFFSSGYANVKDAKDVLLSNDQNAVMEYAGQIMGDSGNVSHLKSVPSGGWTVTMVRQDAEHMEEIIRFIDYMTRDEATLDAFYGTGTYDIVDGVYKKSIAVDQEFQDDYEQAAKRYLMNLEFFIDWTVIQKYLPKSEWRTFCSQYADCEIYDSKAWDAAKEIKSGSPLFETKQLIEEYYRGAEIKILTSASEEECIQRYEEAIRKMDELGLRELEAYEQQQYQEAKRRLP